MGDDGDAAAGLVEGDEALGDGAAGTGPEGHGDLNAASGGRVDGGELFHDGIAESGGAAGGGAGKERDAGADVAGFAVEIVGIAGLLREVVPIL